jgi:hypothetical protein
MQSAISTGALIRLSILGAWAFSGLTAYAGTERSPADAEVRLAVERFLVAAGHQDADAMAALFAPGSSIASAELRKGHWVTESQSFDAWLWAVRAAQEAEYVESIAKFSASVDDGQLAFVRIETDVSQGGVIQAHNVDYFTLLRDNKGVWKFVNGSYTSKPVERK